MTIEIAHVKVTANVMLTATVQASATTVITAPALTFDDWTRVTVEFFSEYVGEYAPPLALKRPWWKRLFAAKPFKRPPVPVCLNLWMDSADVGRIGIGTEPRGDGRQGLSASYSLMVGPGSHTFTVRGWLGRSGLGRVGASRLRVLQEGSA